MTGDGGSAQPSAEGGWTLEDITVVELLWARSLLVSQVALAELQGGAE